MKMFSTQRTVITVSLALFVSLASSTQYVVPMAALKSAPYAEWAHHHWVWLSSDRANQSSMTQYAKEYMDHGIKVGAVDIDSAWSTGFNNFIFDTKKYPNATEMIQHFHSQNIRVILWATSIVDTTSSNYQEGYNNKYFVRDILDVQAVVPWWHGKGGLLDYSNPQAVNWWHSQLDNVLDLGIDGWKVDNSDLIINLVLGAHGYANSITREEYSDHYYGDFFNYTREKLGDDRLIMSRPVDKDGSKFQHFSPRQVVLSGWVGDQDPTFQGLEGALKRYLQSAWANYANFGSDIGGYMNDHQTIMGRTKELLIRWAQLGAFSPLMENGGNQEHRPWAFDNQTLEIYRKFVDIHYQLVPYLLTTGSNAFDSGSSSIRPLADRSCTNEIIDDFKPPTYNYLLGDTILVAPVISDPSVVSVKFPRSGNGSSEWVYWFNHSQVYSEGDTASFNNMSLDEFPVFKATGSVIPLRITDDTPFYGSRLKLVDVMKWWLFLPLKQDTHQVGSFSVREFKGTGIIGSWRWVREGCVEFNITAHTSIRSIVEIEALIGGGTVSVTERNPGGHYVDLPVVSRDSLSHLVAKTGGVCSIHRQNGQLYTMTIFPRGNGKKGHSFLLQFAPPL